MGKLKQILCKRVCTMDFLTSFLKDSHQFIRLSVNIVLELNGCFTLVFYLLTF